MPPKSRRKKKYAGQRRHVAPTATSVPSAPKTAAPVMPKEPVVRPSPRTGAPKTPGQMAPSPYAGNIGREVRTIAIMAVAAVIVIVALSLVLR